jgi:hypothetical protein
VATNGDVLDTTFAHTASTGIEAVTATEGMLTLTRGAQLTILADPLTGATSSAIAGFIEYGGLPASGIWTSSRWLGNCWTGRLYQR